MTLTSAFALDWLGRFFEKCSQAFRVHLDGAKCSLLPSSAGEETDSRQFSLASQMVSTCICIGVVSTCICIGVVCTCTGDVCGFMCACMCDEFVNMNFPVLFHFD